MRTLFEFGFDLCYLVAVFWLAYLLLRHRGRQTGRLFGIMALVLGAGDLFHLVPRMAGLLGRPAGTPLLGLGKLVTSITATIFYLLLYLAWRRYYRVQGPSRLVWMMCAVRVALCLLPQNRWFSGEGEIGWAILRNLPFLVVGAVVAWLFWREERKSTGSSFRCMPLGIALSFACYLPVVVLADRYPMAGMLMIPKTLAYLWMLAMAMREARSC